MKNYHTRYQLEVLNHSNYRSAKSAYLSLHPPVSYLGTLFPSVIPGVDPKKLPPRDCPNKISTQTYNSYRKRRLQCRKAYHGDGGWGRRGDGVRGACSQILGRDLKEAAASTSLVQGNRNGIGGRNISSPRALKLWKWAGLVHRSVNGSFKILTIIS